MSQDINEKRKSFEKEAVVHSDGLYRTALRMTRNEDDGSYTMAVTGRDGETRTQIVEISRTKDDSGHSITLTTASGKTLTRSVELTQTDDGVIRNHEITRLDGRTIALMATINSETGIATREMTFTDSGGEAHSRTSTITRNEDGSFSVTFDDGLQDSEAFDDSEDAIDDGA